MKKPCPVSGAAPALHWKCSPVTVSGCCPVLCDQKMNWIWSSQDNLFSTHICLAGSHTSLCFTPSKTENVINSIWKFSLSTFAAHFISLPPQKLHSGHRHLPWRHTRKRINIIIGVWIFSLCKCIMYFAWLWHNRKSKAKFYFFSAHTFLLSFFFFSEFCIVHIARFFFSQLYPSSYYLESKIQTYPAPWGFRIRDAGKDLLLYLWKPWVKWNLTNELMSTGFNSVQATSREGKFPSRSWCIGITINHQVVLLPLSNAHRHRAVLSSWLQLLWEDPEILENRFPQTHF